MVRKWAVLAGIGLGLLLAAVSTEAEAQPVAVVIEGLHGTLTRPAGATTALLIIPGSGPTDRHGNGGGLRTDAYKQLTEALGKAGYVSLAYDKRGVGASLKDRQGVAVKEEDLTIQTFADDAAALGNWLRGQAGITRVLLAGHSEGGLIALLAAKAAKADGLVLLNAPGRPLGIILRAQLSRQPLPEDLRAEIERVLIAYEAGADTGVIKAPLDQLFRPTVGPFMRSVVSIDPAALAKQQAVPMLVIGAGFDLQVGRFDFDALVAARPGVTGQWIARLTHMLKEPADDDPAQVKAYSDPSVPLSPAVVEIIVKWLQP